MHRAIGDGRRRAVTHHLIEERRRDAGGVHRVAEPLLFNERAGFQPFKQGSGVGGDDLHLRKMDMRVDEPRRQKMWPVVIHGNVRASQTANSPVIAGCRDDTVLDQHRAILDIAIGSVVLKIPWRLKEGQEAAAYQSLCHWF